MQSSNQPAAAQSSSTPVSPSPSQQTPDQILADLTSSGPSADRFHTPDSWYEPDPSASPGHAPVPPQPGYPSMFGVATPAPDSSSPAQNPSGGQAALAPAQSPSAGPGPSPDLGAFPPPGGPLFTVVSPGNSALAPTGQPADPSPAGDPPGQNRSSKLRSPMLGDAEETQKLDNESVAKTKQATSKRGGLRSPLLSGDDMQEEDPEVQRLKRTSRNSGSTATPEPTDETPQRRSRGLHSPLLGGDDQVSTGGTGSKGRSSLRSPLLGADDFDDEPTPHQNVSGKISKSVPLHSPLLGGDEDFGGGRHKSERTEFPHRSRNRELHDSDSFGDAEGAEPQPQQRISGRVSGRRLHSPVLDGTGDFYLEEQNYQPETYDENDPNVLRSPLLAAKQKLSIDKPVEPALPAAPAPVTLPAVTAASSAPVVLETTASYSVPPPAPTEMSSLTATEKPSPGSSSSSSKASTARSSAPSQRSSQEEHTRVPLSIYDSGLRQTVPGAPVRTGPSVALILPCVIGLICKVLYFIDLSHVPDIMTKTWFMADQGGQVLVLLGIIVYGLNAKRSS